MAYWRANIELLERTPVIAERLRPLPQWPLGLTARARVNVG